MGAPHLLDLSDVVGEWQLHLGPLGSSPVFFLILTVKYEYEYEIYMYI